MEEQGQEEAPVAVDMDNGDNRVASSQGFQEQHTTVTYTSTKRSMLQYLVRGFTVMVGFAVVGAGVHGYFNSIWNGIIEYPGFHKPFCFQKAEFVLVPYATDEGKPIILKKDSTNYDCPSLGLETIFISVAMAVFLLSLANFILSFSQEYKCEWTKRWEVIYHYVAGALLIIGAALNMYSACIIRYITLITAKNNDVKGRRVLLLGPQETHPFAVYSRNYIQLFDAKIASACLAFVNGIVYIIAGLTLRNAQGPPGKGCIMQ